MTHCFNKGISGEQNQQKDYPDSALSAWFQQLHLHKGLQTTLSEVSKKVSQSAFRMSTKSTQGSWSTDEMKQTYETLEEKMFWPNLIFFTNWKEGKEKANYTSLLDLVRDST